VPPYLDAWKRFLGAIELGLIEDGYRRQICSLGGLSKHAKETHVSIGKQFMSMESENLFKNIRF